MSSNEFLLDWLNKDLKFQPNILDITKEFANGYKFAELLHFLEEITQKDLQEFKNSQDSEEIKENFIKIKKLLHDKLCLEIREEEFNEVIQFDPIKASIILYKIKNSFNRKKINFLNILTFTNPPTKEEITNKVVDLLENESAIDYYEYEDEVKEKAKNLRYSLKATQNDMDLHSIKSVSEKNMISEENVIEEDKKNEKTDRINKNTTNFKNLNININNSNLKSLYNNTLSNKGTSNDFNNTLNANQTFDSKKEKENQITYNTMATMDYNTSHSKRFLKPIQNLYKYKITNKTKTNLTPKSLPKLNTNTEYKSSIMNSNIGTLSTYSIFNEKLNLNSPTIDSLYKNVVDFNNDLGMLKIKELKDKMLKKQLEDMKKQEEIKNELKIKKINQYDIQDKYRLDFVNKINNPLYKFTKFTGINLFLHSDSKYNSSSRRVKYSKNLKLETHREEIERQIAYIRKLMHKNTESMNMKLKEKNKTLNAILNDEKNSEPFNKLKYFRNLNKLKFEDYDKFLKEKYGNKDEAIPLINKLCYSIIELMEDISDYLIENEKEIIDVEDFKKFSEWFIKDEHPNRNEIDKDALQIKNAESQEDANKQIDLDNLALTEDEICLIQDYINYIGLWNDEKIINNDLKGYKFELRKIRTDLPSEYEPTENELEDITLPVKISDNYTLGNTLLTCIDTKYSSNKDSNKDGNDSLKENIFIKEKENVSLSKWKYIPYKISLVGYPLSGRQFIAENLLKKYPNMKIYSIKKIFRDYYIEYKNITEQIEGNPKYKSMKPNQLTQMKEEKEKQLQEFSPILNIIQPFIDLIKEEKRRKKLEEEERIKREKELESQINNSNAKGKKKTKSQNKNPPKTTANKKANDAEHNPEFEEDNINDDLKKIPSDEILFNLLKYQIELDFPKKPKQENEKEIIEYQTKVFQVLKQIENLQKQKQEAARPNPKDDVAINNLQKDLENLKVSSIKGFILVDYPSNINQSMLLENYLTGYVDETQKPKSEKSKIINSLSNFLDFKIHPKENNTVRKAGIDFVINIVNQEKDVDERFNSKKYDPVTDKIYTKSDLSDENKNKQALDKKIIERLVNDVPYLTKENFDFYKDEYNTNIPLMTSLYNKFGMYVEVESGLESEINILGIDFNEKEVKKCFQTIELENLPVEEIHEEEDPNNKKAPNDKKKNEKKPNMNLIFELEEKNKNKVIDFISNEVINWIYKDKDKSDKIIFYSNHPEYNVNEENDRIKFDPELKVNEINNDRGKKTVKVQSNNSSLIVGESRISNLVNKNADHVIKQLVNFNEKYKKSLGKFIYLINNQKHGIHKRLNLIQRKFRDFLNHKTNKKKVIHIYVSKYNEFFKEKPSFFLSKKANEEFSKDIEEINNNIWLLINEKEKESIKELDLIKSSGFIEKELEKFYDNLKELNLVETERFITMINSILFLYTNNSKNKEEHSTLFRLKKLTKKRDSKLSNELNSSNSSFNEKKEVNINKLNLDKNYIVKNTFPVIFDPKDTSSSFINKTQTHSSFSMNNQKRESKSEIMVNNLMNKISQNIEIMFMNSIKLILEYHETVDKLIKEIKNAASVANKKFFKKKTTKYNISNNSSMMTSMYGGSMNALNEKLIKMLQNEKNRYKYRMCYLKSFAYKYMAIITQTCQNVYTNVDQWIVTNVSLQNDALNMIISLLKKKLKEHRFINEKNEINTIEMDEFEKIIDDNEEGGAGSEIGIKPIDNSSVMVGRIYSKLNIDYLINNNFIDIKVEEIINQTQKEEDAIYKRIKNKKFESKKYKMILPNELDRSINSSINNSFGAGGIKNKLKEYDFYFDINKFNQIYTNLKKYEIEQNIISKDLFYEVFIKQYFIDKYGENDESENINLGINHINKIEKKRSIDNKLKTSMNESDEEEDENINSINDNLINHQNNSHILNAICPALKMLNTKNFHKIYSLYQIPMEHKTSHTSNTEKKENKEIKEENKENDIIEEKNEENKDENKDESKDKDIEKENKEKIKENEKEKEKDDKKENNNSITDKKENDENTKKEDNNENNNKEKENNINEEKYAENKEEKIVEYETYLNTPEIFTILPLIGCRILNLIEEEHLMNDLKEKLIRGRYLSKSDFMEYHFWFEPDFEYQNEDIMFQQMLEENKDNNNLGVEDYNKSKKMNVKEFLFNLWKDEKGDKMDFQQFIGVLKINKYITDLNALKEQNYYNIIFKSEN